MGGARASALASLRLLLRRTVKICARKSRLRQRRLEAARVAEDAARKAAREAVRQLRLEHCASLVIQPPAESGAQP